MTTTGYRGKVSGIVSLMNRLASIQPILAVDRHPNADLLDIVSVLGYRAIVKRDTWKPGDVCVFIEPDSVLPDAPWSAFYRAKSNRVKAIRLRSVWSQGVVESPTAVGYTGALTPGLDITEAIGVTKYDPPMPQDLAASGPYGLGIPKTDEDRFESIDPTQLPPWGTLVDVTLKIDGQSWSAFYRVDSEGVASSGIGGRSFLYKLDCDNNFTRNAREHRVLDKLKTFCSTHAVNLCVRGEQYGTGIQKGGYNPHSKVPLGLALYSVWLIDERRYARKGHPFYIHAIAEELRLPTVPVLERDVPLTPELVAKYSEGLEAVNGQPFEGVVIQHATGSFKVINKAFDSRK